MTDNPLKNTRIEFHILQSFPVTCLNRDDVGSPKTAVVGGVTRARVSSQCWKRQVRLAMRDFGVRLGTRSKSLAVKICEKCVAAGADAEAAKACSEAIANALAKDTLYFFTDSEVAAYADFAAKLGYDAKAVKEKEVQKLAKKVLKPGVDGLDIALFGRMVAQDPELNVQAAAAFAHAVSTHAVSNEVEFFTALDDLQDAPGAAHMDNLEFNSATYYRYVSLDLGQLWESLEGQDLDKAVAAFVKALFVAIPAARQSTLSGACGWDYARVLVRRGQRVQLSFDEPVRSKNGYLKPSIEKLNEELERKGRLFGSLYGLLADYTIGDASGMNIDTLVSSLTEEVGKLNG